jgi:hypothetical protein
MEDDDPMRINAIYQEPEDPVKDEEFDVTVAGNSDMTARFTNIALKGDFYNGFPGGKDSGRGGGMPEGMPPGGGTPPDGGMPDGPGGPGGTGGAGPMRGPSSGLNMVLSFENADVTGVITSSRARHAKSTITSEDYRLLGEVTNRPCPAVNNGVIVTLEDSTWTVTGTSYLTNLTIGEDSAIVAPEGYSAIMTVDGFVKTIKTGAYKGDIVITVAE